MGGSFLTNKSPTLLKDSYWMFIDLFIFFTTTTTTPKGQVIIFMYNFLFSLPPLCLGKYHEVLDQVYNKDLQRTTRPHNLACHAL